VAEPSTAPRRLQLLLIRGGRAPNVHVSLVAGGGHSPTLTVAEAGGSAPEREGESVAVIGAASRSGAAPEMVGSKRAAPEPAGSKREAPEQGSSDRLMKKARVHSKM
jgi:hypothetical protein